MFYKSLFKKLQKVPVSLNKVKTGIKKDSYSLNESKNNCLKKIT